MASKVALLHDWLTGFRGGERVLEAMCETYPQAPLYTLIYVPGSTSEIIEKRPVHSTFLNRLPGVEKHYRKFLPLFPKAAESLKIDENVDVVLSSSHCVIKGVKKPKGAVHVSYIHSPMRYMYDQYEHYFGPQASLPIRVGAWAFRDYLVNWDKASNANVDVMVANSAFVRERIRKFYGRDALVVHPFVELRDFEHLSRIPAQKEEHYAMVTAFAPNKRVDLAIEAFNELKKPLTIIGGGQLDQELRAMAGPTINFLGNVDRATVIDVLSKARAFIFPGVEDFGITPLEAMASGTPVIAFKAGGVLETLTDEDTVFFEEPTSKSLIEAVQQFERDGRKTNWSRLQAFSRERFQKQMADVVAEARENI
jgi:glycosyltransferase involved in cell wall biosynthesis